MNPKDTFVIQGLAGKRTLKGTVSIGGAKNAALKAMAAALLFDGPVTLSNVPDISDIRTLTLIMEKLGADIKIEKQTTSDGQSGQTMTIDTSKIKSTDIDQELAKSMRASVVLTGPMLSRFGKVSFPMPGGCVIGTRSIDLFLSGYEKMKATMEETESAYVISAASGLKGTNIFFDKVTVGGTETLMMAAVLAHGVTILKNCAMEPEIANVAEWLNSCGADISGINSPTLVIRGTGGKLLSPKAPFQTIPDRITAGSFLILGALTAEELTIDGCWPGHIEAVTQLLSDLGVKMEIKEDSITVYGAQASKPYGSISSLRTHEYPGFPTDLQSPVVTFLTQSTGESIILETIFDGRFKYIEDLMLMGADITIMNPREVLIKGPTDLRQLSDNEEVTSHDIRAGFAIVMAALIGEGRFVVNNVHLIDRGYAHLEQILTSLGAEVKRVKG